MKNNLNRSNERQSLDLKMTMRLKLSKFRRESFSIGILTSVGQPL